MSDGNGSTDKDSAFTRLTEFDSLRPGKKQPRRVSMGPREPTGEVNKKHEQTPAVAESPESDRSGNVTAPTRHNSAYTDQRVFRRLLAEARPYRRQILLSLLLSLVATPLALLQPVPLKIAVDSVLNGDPVPSFLTPLVPGWVEAESLRLLGFAAILLVAIVLLLQLQSLASTVWQTFIVEQLTLRFRARLLNHAQRLSFAFHDQRGTADSIYRIQWDAMAVQNVAVYAVVPFIGSLIMLAAMVFVVFRLSWQLAVVALAVTPVLFLLARVYRIRMRPEYKRTKKLESSALQVVQEVLTSFRVVKAFGREEHEEERFVNKSAEGVTARIRLALAENAFGLMVALTTAIGTAAVLFVGVQQVQEGALTVGELLVIISYLAALYGPVQTISRKVATLQNQLASGQRAFELLDEIPDVVERPDAKPILRAEGRVEFKDVHFSYDGETDVLAGVSFVAPPGVRLGVVGRTGAGKTTLMSLLTRFYDPSSGVVTIDATDIRDYRLADLRNQFSIVLQDPVLFSTSIADNIAYARPGASMHEIVDAAKAADAHGFITAMPNAYDTIVGERGMRLSGGERQRVALARAFLKNAPILILDEPTSSVDTETEAAIMDTMYRLMEGRTTFMIAHRLSTLEGCDALLEVGVGRVSLNVAHVAANPAISLHAEPKEDSPR